MKIKRIFKIAAICVFSLIVLAGVVLGGWTVYRHMINRYTLEISYAQDRDITVEYGTHYVEPELTAKFSGTILQTRPIDVPVSVSGQVDTGRLGTYLVKYTAQYKNHIGTAYRRVQVVDTQAPVITLHTKPDNTVLPGESYQEEGYTAVDNHDGNITDRVQRQVDKHKIVYTVSDSSGNVAIAEREIIYSDLVAPILKLNGSDCVTLRVGQNYEEPGYVAGDNCDGNLTSKVRVSGTIDTSKSGVYTLSYSVEDRYGNKTSVERRVVVVSVGTSPKPSVVVPDGKVIYLTFDDGPGPHTARLLDILKKYDVKATFFVTNKPKYKNLIKRASEEGHAIGIHTMTHTYKSIYKSPEAYYKDLYGMQDVIEKITGKKTTLFRFPGGSSNTVSRKYCKGLMTFLTKELVVKGFQYFDWNVDSKDAGGAKTAEQVFQNVISGVGKKQYAVVLQHDVKKYSVDAVESIIQWGLANGYAFLPLEPSSPGCHHNVKN